MSAPLFAGETVTVLVAGTETDPYSGEETPSWDVPHASETDARTLAPPEPRPADEQVQDARNSVTSGWTLYLPVDTPVTAYDRMRVRGIEYPVQGTPAMWHDVGLVVQCYVTEG
jgi:hypothetical protein